MAAILALAPIVFGLLALSALFSAAETSLTGASRARMHQLEREGDRGARRHPVVQELDQVAEQVRQDVRLVLGEADDDDLAAPAEPGHDFSQVAQRP